MTSKQHTNDVHSTLWLLALAAFGSSMSMRLCDPMLPLFALEFDRPVTSIAPIVTLFTIAYGIFSLVHGPWGDRRGKLNVVSWATLMAAVGSAASALAVSYEWLLALRFVSGAACAAIIPLSLAWIGDSLPSHERQQTLARFSAATISGMILGQVIGGIFADTIGWRAAFALAAVVFLIAGLRLLFFARAHQPSLTDSPSGNVVSGYLALFRNKWMRFVIVVVALEGALVVGAMTFIPTRLHLHFNLPLWQAGLVMAMNGFGGLYFSWRSKALIKRLGESGMALLGALALGTGLCSIVFLPHWLFSLPACALMGFGFSMLHNTLQNLATQAHPDARGTAIAGFVLALFIGQAVGVSLAAWSIAQIGFETTFVAIGFMLAGLGNVAASGFARRASEAPKAIS
ncbi:MAG: MFS transporter [Granulosicoccus sp.]